MSRTVVGVDVGGTLIRAARFDADGTIHDRLERRTPTTSGEFLDALEAAIAELVDEGTRAVGIGVPGTIDRRTGEVVHAFNLPLIHFGLAAHLRSRFDVACVVENDGQVAAIAEWKLGAGRGTRHMLALAVGTGIGGGMILDGRPYRGSIGAGGELGALFLEMDGETSTLETLASGNAAAREAQAVYGRDADAAELVVRAAAGEEVARRIVAMLGGRLGTAIASLVNVFNPEAVVVGGGFAVAAGDLLLEPAREAVRRLALSPARDVVSILPAQLGADAGLVGAGLLALEALDEPEPAVAGPGRASRT